MGIRPKLWNGYGGRSFSPWRNRPETGRIPLCHSFAAVRQQGRSFYLQPSFLFPRLIALDERNTNFHLFFVSFSIFSFWRKRIKNLFLPMTQHFLLAQRVVTARETDKKNGKVDYRPPAAYTISLPIKIWLRKRNKPVAMSLSWWEHFLLIPPRGSSPKYNCSNGIRNCCRDNEPTHFHRHRWNVVGDQRAECQFTNFCVILQIFAYRRTLLSARMILLVALFPANHIWIITGTDLRRQSSQRPSRQCELVDREILFLSFWIFNWSVDVTQTRLTVRMRSCFVF